MLDALTQRWKGPAGCAHVLRIALPLILSTGAHTVQMFVDRVFLSWYSLDAMSAAFPAGIMVFAVAALFFGTVSYANTFVAQYVGARQPHNVGHAVWQALYLGIIAGLAMLALIPLATPLFNWIAHDPAVRQHEITYFRIMCVNPVPMLAAAALTTFFTGRGQTWTVLYVNASATVVNIILDYGLIFGHFHLPAWGIAGAAWATVISSAVAAVGFACLFLRPVHRSRFHTITGARADLKLFMRLLRFGLPNGVQFMLDILAFTVFVILVGQINPTVLAATNMTFQINMLAFMPMVGLGIAVTTLVGQALGANDVSRAQRTTWSGFYLTFTYMTSVAIAYILVPRLFLYPFAAGSDPQAFAQIQPLAQQLLIFVALYSIFDGANIIFAGALKGAGDTRFVMVASVGLSWTLLALPSYLAIHYQWGPQKGLYLAWAFLTLYVCALATTFLLRFLQGKWQSMRVIETPPTPLPTNQPAIPITDPQ